MGYAPLGRKAAKKDDTGGASSLFSGGEEVLVRRELITIPQIAALAIEPYIYFASDIAGFAGLDGKTVENNYRLLVEIAEFLRQNSEYQLVIEGHANPVVNTQSEEQTSLNPLSVERAELVAKTLISYGVNRKRLIIAGSGGTKTLVSWQDRQHWNLNRRVEFTLYRQVKQNKSIQRSNS
jgi:outer membrane protein OmpA-like peptidoglycan-associated protein